MTFMQKLEERVSHVHSLVSVGLDCADFEFNKAIIDQTHTFVCAYKLNFGFYEASGGNSLKRIASYLREHYPDIATIADAKRGDIGNTNEQYAKAIFDNLGFDAVTLHPYLGKEALLPFLERKDKGCIILCRTSNPGAGEFQDLLVDGKPLWHRVAENVANTWNDNHNCLLVLGATYPDEMRVVRKIVGDEMWFLVPGVGAQGGSVESVMQAGKNSQGTGLIINSSRGIILSKNPRFEAKKLRDEINTNM